MGGLVVMCECFCWSLRSLNRKEKREEHRVSSKIEVEKDTMKSGAVSAKKLALTIFADEFEQLKQNHEGAAMSWIGREAWGC